MVKIVSRPTAAFEGGSDLPAWLQKIYASRQVQNSSEMDQRLANLHSPALLNGMNAAASLLAKALEQQKGILIVGDYDADGATSTALACKALRSMGAMNVHYLLPNRFKDGYGLSADIVRRAHQQYAPDIIITVDNGISSCEGIDVANTLGIQVLVTDHHLPGEQLPDAEVIINPNLADDPFPSKALAGVGVIFYVMLGLRQYLEQKNWFDQQGIVKPNMADLLDLVALGTVADVVTLDQNNRILVEQGLRRIRAGFCCEGIKALMKITGRNPRLLKATDLGFSIAPRINAAGRLDSMSLGVECLLSEQKEEAEDYARQLDTMNAERRLIESDMREQAIAQVEGWLNGHHDRKLPVAICLQQSDWHEGVLGIVASRLKDQLHRPVIAFGLSGEETLKGSARSIPGLHIRDVLFALATRHGELINQFGGHAMAAGLTIPREKFHQFTAAFIEEVSAQLGEQAQEKTITTDGSLATELIALETAEVLHFAGPWGQGFPAPVFDDCFRVEACRNLRGGHLRMKVKPLSSEDEFEAIYFSPDEDFRAAIEHADQFRFVYSLDINEYRNKRSLQLVIKHAQST